MRDQDTPPHLDEELDNKIKNSATLTELWDKTALRLNKVGRFARGTIRAKNLLRREDYNKIFN